MYHLAYLHSAGLNHRDLKKIFETEENYESVYERVLDGTYTDIPWITEERKQKIFTHIRELKTHNIEKTLVEKNIQLITLHDSRYPEQLRTIKQAPFFLYVRGDLHNERKMLGIVWSRKNTSYGKKVLEKIIPELIQERCGIISGWAYGIDAISHEIALEHGGYTVSVFWCSVDIYYPSQNSVLFDRILSSGWALVSIFPIGTRAEPYMFPIRNEIVAALSDGIIIPEAGIKSGTLITATLALEHGRDVFAIPWDIFRETSEGTNQLIIRWEAKCTRNARDILEEYFPTIHNTPTSLFSEKVFENEEQEKIYNCITEWYNTPDSIWENTYYPIDIIMTGLAMLEINWHIRLWNHGSYEVI